MPHSASNHAAVQQSCRLCIAHAHTSLEITWRRAGEKKAVTTFFGLKVGRWSFFKSKITRFWAVPSTPLETWEIRPRRGGWLGRSSLSATNDI